MENPGAEWAIKEIRETMLEDDERNEAIVRFMQEARLLGSLNHTGISYRNILSTSRVSSSGNHELLI